MVLTRRVFGSLAAAALAAPNLVGRASAQSYPNRYVRFVVPFAGGGGADAVARPLANRLTEMWGQSVVVENRGGGGNIGAQAVAQSPPDGYTFLLGSLYLVTNPYLYPSPGFDSVADFAPVSRVSFQPSLLAVSNSSPVKSIPEFIAFAKAHRGQVTYASSGVGTSNHLSGELFKRMAGIEMTHVPYRGAAPALNDLISGRVDGMFSTALLPQVQSGIVRGLAVTSAARFDLAPNLPTIAESGVPGFDVTSWYGIFMPAKTPPDIIRKVHDDVVAALAHPQVRQKIADAGSSVSSSTPAELAAQLKSELNKWGPIIKDAGIKPE
jgi:tripartite-type tricarboxylate transporter receptor subunit TctC